MTTDAKEQDDRSIKSEANLSPTLPRLTHSTSDDGKTSEGELPTLKIASAGDIPWKWRIPAFCLILVWGTGASFADVTIGPLKSTLIRELGINSES